MNEVEKDVVHRFVQLLLLHPKADVSFLWVQAGGKIASQHRVHTDEGEAEAQEARPNQLDTGEGWGPSGNRPRG